MFAAVCVGTSMSIHGPDSQANCCVNDLGTGNVSCDEQPLIDRPQNVPTPINVNTPKLLHLFKVSRAVDFIDLFLKLL